MAKLRRVLVLDQNYPSADNFYSDAFVHLRAREYAKRAEVLVAAFPSSRPDWVHEGIPVRSLTSIGLLNDLIRAYQPDVLAVHFAEGAIITDVLLKTRVPFVVWVHGYEAMGWYRTAFAKPKHELPGFAVSATRRLLKFRKLVLHAQRTGQGIFVTPSRWLQQVVQLDTLTRLPRAEILPNPIDGELFRHIEKGLEMRARVLLLRSFSSRKYATDVAVDAIVRLSRHRAFGAFEFNLYGKGALFARDAAKVRRFSNVHLHEQFVPHADIPRLHAAHGVMLCPTRQDTHGVTMCEAMASGLVPLATPNSAIPEFVTHGVSGLLSRSSTELAEHLARLHDDPGLFQRLSRAAAAEVRSKCGLPEVIERELAILERAAARGGAC